MVYYAQDSAQFVAWKQLTDMTDPAVLTTETLYLAAQYEGFKVWGEYIRRYGNLNEAQARELIQVVIDGWIFLQIMRLRRMSSNSSSTSSSSDPGTEIASGGSETDSDATLAPPPPLTVDYQLARRKAKEGALEALGKILEFDMAKLLRHFDRFLNTKGE